MSPSTDSGTKIFRAAVLSVVKHDYVARGVERHPRFDLVVVADDPQVPDWVHERNQKFADEKPIPYIRDVERALKEFQADVAIVSPEAERHCDLSVRAANLGIHVIQDKPMSTNLSECDRLVEAADRNKIKTLIWNRNMLPAVLHAKELIDAGEIGRPYSIHADFYFAKDAGPPKGSRPPQDPPLNWLELQKAAHAEGADGGVGTAAMGELQVEGIYPLAYIHLLTGATVERVYARTTAMFHQGHFDNDVDDLASVSLEMTDGILGTLAIGRIGAASHPEIGEIKIHVLGTDGALVIAEARPEVAVYYRNQPDKEFPHRRIAIDNDFLLTDSFAKAIDHDGESLLNARTARALTAAVEAAIRSGKTGRAEAVER